MPICKRCCFCIPLRYGLLVWGYLKLLLCCFTTVSLYSEWKFIFHNWPGIGASLITHASVVTIIVIADITLAVTLIMGSYQKNVKLLKIFYICTIVMIGLTVVLQIYYLINTIITINTYHHINYRDMWMSTIIQLVMYTILLFMQIYIVILVRSEMIKLNNNYQFRFTNNAAKAECTLKVEAVDSKE